jgi:hypothetical protein
MAKRRNSGIVKQDSIIAQFSKDARSNTDNCAVMQCMVKGKRIVKPEEPRMSMRFLIKGE